MPTKPHLQALHNIQRRRLNPPHHTQSRITKPAHNTKTFPRAGVFTTTHPSPSTARRATTRLARTRLALIQDLEGKIEYHQGDRQAGFEARLAQVAVLNGGGALDELPVARVPRVRSLREIAEERMLVGGRSGLRSGGSLEEVLAREQGRDGWAGREAGVYWGEDEDWGLVPGEEKGEEEGDLGRDMEIWEFECVEEETVERIEQGAEVQGVWRNLLVKEDGGGEVEVVARWAMRQMASTRQAQEGAIMDGHCMKVVEAVRRIAGC